MKSIILDTETTGLKDGRPVEIAWIDLNNHAVRFHSYYNG